MGGTQSNNTSKILNDIAMTATTKVMMSCVTSTAQSQSINFGHVGGNFSLDKTNLSQSVSVDASCAASSATTAEVAQQVGNAVAEHAESKGQAVLSALGNTKSSVASDITNKMSNSFENITSTSLITQTTQDQSIGAAVVGGNVTLSNITMEQGATVMAHAMLNNTATQEVLSTIANTIDQKTTSAEENPIAGIINSVGNAIGSIVSAPILIIGAIILGIIGIFIVLKLAL
uniref:Uncharacterized protein n=1 Tax=viral metagenome TaxID=1070528 RepID=A0A6C0JV97_9ZZZZ